MSRDNFSRGKNRNNWNNKNNNQKNQAQNRADSQKNNRSNRNFNGEHRSSYDYEIRKQVLENDAAIKEFKSNVCECEICGQPITDLSSAMNNKKTSNPVHFDCVISELSKTENPGPNDKITYIGNGKFAILHFENVHDMRHFSIVKEIEWEVRDSSRGEWRDKMANLYSQIK